MQPAPASTRINDVEAFPDLYGNRATPSHEALLAAASSGRASTSLQAAVEKGRAVDAAEALVQSADSIMDALRVASERAPAGERHTPLYGHSPFMACSQVASGYAYTVVAATMAFQLGLTSSSSSSGAGATGGFSSSFLPSFGGGSSGSGSGSGSGAGHSSSDGSTGSEGDAAHSREANVWRHRAVLSNLGAAHSNLLAVADMWPVARGMAGEVENCRTLVDRTGPLLLF